MSYKFDQILPLTTEWAAIDCLKIDASMSKHRCLHFFSVAIDPMLFKLAGIEDTHHILDEFEFRPNQTSGDSCP